MSFPTNEFGATFWLSLAAIVSALLGVCLKSMYQSKCQRIDLCGIHIERDIISEVKEDMAENRVKSEQSLTIPQLPKRRASV